MTSERATVPATRGQLALFFVLSYALSWLAWLPLVLRSRGVDAPVLPLHHYLGAVGPIGAACAVTWLFEGRAGLRSLLAGLIRWRVGWRWLALALLGPVALFLLAWAAVGLSTGTWSSLRGFGACTELSAFGLLGTWLFHTLTFGVGEETGWRGFALPRLQARRGPLVATLLLTFVWAGWHAPAFLYRPGYSAMTAGMVLGWLASLATGSVLLTWIYNRTRGSILAVSLFHGSVDLVFTSDAAAGTVSSVTGALMMIAAGIVVAVSRPRRTNRSSSRTTLAPPSEHDLAIALKTRRNASP